jgi:hypothetical protein
MAFEEVIISFTISREHFEFPCVPEFEEYPVIGGKRRGKSVSLKIALYYFTNEMKEYETLFIIIVALLLANCSFDKFSY